MAGKLQHGIVFLLSLCIAVLFSVSTAAAQEPEFRLDMDSLNLQKGVSCNIVLSLINVKDAQIISIEGLEEFDVLSENSSTSTSIVNNVATYQIDVYYAVMPKTTGQFTLKANIRYNGQDYETNALEVTVTENTGSGSEIPDLFVKTVVSHEEAYLGEKIIVTYELYSRVSIESCGFTNYSAIDGVISKEIPSDQLKSENVYIDGNRYAMYEIKQLIIDPMKAGVCTIPSFNLQANVIDDNSRGGFGGFGGLFNTATPHYLQTEEKVLTIKPLPQEGKPSDFSGIVGELKLDSNYSRTELNYGDSLTLQINASGNCNLDGVKSIVGNGIPGFTVYENQKNAVESTENNLYHVQKTFEAILIPEKNGELHVGPVSISYFNPVSGKYETAEIPKTTINVLGDIPLTNINNGSQSSEVETVLINQVNYANAGDGYFNIQLKKELVYTIFIGAVVLLVLAAGLMWLVFDRKKRNSELKLLYKKLMSTKDTNEIYLLFNTIIKKRYNVNLKASSKNAVLCSLPDAELAEKVTEIMDYMESAQAHDEKGHIQLKEKIKGIYTAKLRKA